MAIDPSSKYPTQIDVTDTAGYPLGKAQNVTTSGDGSGTPLEKDWVNDLWGFFQGLLGRFNITPSGVPDTAVEGDYIDALTAWFGTRQALKVHDLDLDAGDFIFEGSAADDWGQLMKVSDAPLGSLSSPRQLEFAPDGLRAWAINGGTETVHQYDFTTPFDLTTASYSAVSYDASTELTGSGGAIVFKPDGLAMFLGDTISNAVFQYTLTTAWDITAGVSYATDTLDTSSETTQLRSLQFSADGTTLWVGSSSDDFMYSYTGTAYDLSTFVYTTDSIDLTSGPLNLIGGAYLSADGLRVVAIGNSAGTDLEYRQWDLGTPFDISTAVAGAAKTTLSAPGSMSAASLAPDGTRFFVTAQLSEDIYSIRVNRVTVGF